MQLAEKMLPYMATLLIREYNPKKGCTPSNSEQRLRQLVEKYSFRRNYNDDFIENKRARDLIISDFEACGYKTTLYNNCDNIVIQDDDSNHPRIAISGHYDGPQLSPGADDNASAIASMIHLAENLEPELRKKVKFLAFNREECNILGSKLFLNENIDDVKSSILLNLNLEMVGYFSDAPNSQQMPEGFPAIDKGDFLAIVGNQNSGDILKKLVKYSKQNNLSLPLKGFNIPFGLENKINELHRLLCSDHSRFWEHNIPAVMLTDTSDYRNANYHMQSDLPDTLNYTKMAGVVDLLYQFVKSYKVPLEA